MKTTFWATVPGLLTGVAALLTAVVGLLVFLSQRRNSTRPSGEPAITVQTARLPPGERTEFVTHLVTLRVSAPPAVLEKVQTVTYLLPPSFGADSFTSSSPADGYPIRLSAAGSFLVQAKLHLTDRTTRDLSHQVDLPA